MGIILHGATGRMGTNQHLVRSLLALRREGGLPLASGDRLMPDPVLVGRSGAKLGALAQAHGIERWTTDIDAALAERQRQRRRPQADQVRYARADGPVGGERARKLGLHPVRARTNGPGALLHRATTLRSPSDGI